jgi:hypothetical protein
MNDLDWETALDLTWCGSNYNLVWVMSGVYGIYPWHPYKEEE